MGRSLLPLSLLSLSLFAFGCEGVDAPNQGDTDSTEDLGEDQAAIGSQTLDVDFVDCTEIAGVGDIPYAGARAAVPSRYQLAGAPSKAEIVIRVVECSDVVIDGHHDGYSVTSQVGVGIVSPDGTGDINNYTVWYDTSDLRLAVRLSLLGVKARFAPSLLFNFKENASGGGTLDVQSRFLTDPLFEVKSTVQAPPDATIPFLANWWKVSYGDGIRMATEVPQLHFGYLGNVSTLTAPAHTDLWKLIGGVPNNFADLNSFNEFPSAHMHVTQNN